MKPMDSQPQVVTHRPHCRGCFTPVSRTFSALVLAALSLLAACEGQPWNSPYPAGESGENILYSSFDARPNHLDPAQSYSSNEAVFIEQIYEAPLQYHFLKRPYELIPRAAVKLPEPWYLDAQGQRLPMNAGDAEVAFSVYEIEIQPGIRYQPHPAFARHADGSPRYLDLQEEDLEGIYELRDFPETGTRELVAADYVFLV